MPERRHLLNAGAVDTGHAPLGFYFSPEGRQPRSLAELVRVARGAKAHQLRFDPYEGAPAVLHSDEPLISQEPHGFTGCVACNVVRLDQLSLRRELVSRCELTGLYGSAQLRRKSPTGWLGLTCARCHGDESTETGSRQPSERGNYLNELVSVRELALPRHLITQPATANVTYPTCSRLGNLPQGTDPCPVPP